MSQEMQGQPTVIVVQQQAAPVAVEAEQKCCMCIDIPCGITTLLVFEILYLIGFIIFIMGVLFVGAVASGGMPAGL